MNVPIEFNIPVYEKPEDIANYISLLKQIGYSQKDLDQIIKKMPIISEKREETSSQILIQNQEAGGVI